MIITTTDMQPKMYKFVPCKGIARVASDLNIREQPSLESSVKVLPEIAKAGTEFKYVGYITDGAKVHNNSVWYVDMNGNFRWSGNLAILSDVQLKPEERTTGKILHCPLKKLICTQKFAERPEVYKDLGSPGGHNGVDFRTRDESNLSNWKQDVFSVLDGEISEATENKWNGKYVRIRHDNGFESVYLHLSQISVRSGQSVKAGGKIGISGNSGGASEAPHLHFGYRPVKFDKNNGHMGYVDPISLFKDPITFV